MTKKKKLTNQQEFEIMKLVLDKFLWIGFGIMMFGLYSIAMGATSLNGFLVMGAGIVILVLFMFLLVKEYEILK